MQGRQIPTAFRQFPTNRTPFLKILSGVRIGYYFLSVNALFLAVKVAKGQQKKSYKILIL